MTRAGPTTTNPPPETVPGHRASRPTNALALFGSIFVFWILVAWPFAPDDGAIRWGDVAAGIAVALFVAWLLRESVSRDGARALSPTRLFWLFVYLGIFAYYVARGNLDVAYRVLHPALPIRPGIVRVKTRLRSASARTVLANCITLTPGTLTVDLIDDGTLYVHWVNVTTDQDQLAAQQILQRFEWFIGRILE